MTIPKINSQNYMMSLTGADDVLDMIDAMKQRRRELLKKLNGSDGKNVEEAEFDPTQENYKQNDDGSVSYYNDMGYVSKKVYNDGSYREYERDEKTHKLLSSTTYNKDGTKFSYETYSQNAHELFESSIRMYLERTFYNDDGSVKNIETYKYNKDKSGKIIKTTTVKNAEGDVTNVVTSTMDKNKNVYEKITKNAEGKEIEKEINTYDANEKVSTITTSNISPNEMVVSVVNYKTQNNTKTYIKRNADGDVVSTRGYEYSEKEGDYVLKTSLDIGENGEATRVYRSYNQNGGYTDTITYHKTDNPNALASKKTIGGVEGNPKYSGVTEEYGKDGKLLSRTYYNFVTKKTAGDNPPVGLEDYRPNNSSGSTNISQLSSRVTITYNNGDEDDIQSITKEAFSYDPKAADGKTTTVKTYMGKINENGKIEFDKNACITERREATNHNVNNVSADDIINKAKEYLGYKESDCDNYLFGTQGEWCSGFESYVLLELGFDFSELQNRYSTRAMYSLGLIENRFMDVNETFENAPDLKGALVIWNDVETDENQNRMRHIGFVIDYVYKKDEKGKVVGMTITTLEGNAGDEVKIKEYTLELDENGNIKGRNQITGFANFVDDSWKKYKNKN